MTTEIETDMGDTKFDLLFAPGHYLFAQRQGDEVYWYDWSVEFAGANADSDETLFTTGA